MATFSGAVEGWAPMGAGPSGRARWRNESCSDMAAGDVCGGRAATGGGRAARRRDRFGGGVVDIVCEIWAGAVR